MLYAVSLTFLMSSCHKSSVVAWCFSTRPQISGTFAGGVMPHQPLIAAIPVGVKNAFSQNWVGPAGADTNCCAGSIEPGQGHTGCGGASLIPNVAFNLCFSHAVFTLSLHFRPIKLQPHAEVSAYRQVALGKIPLLF